MARMPSPDDDEISVHLHDPAALLASWRNVVIEVWGDDVAPGTVRRHAQRRRQLARSYPAGAGLLSIIGALRFRLPTDLRAAVEETAPGMPDEIRAIAMVIERGGFLTAALHGLTAGLALVMPRRRLHGVFDGIDPAAQWLVSQVRVGRGEPVAETASALAAAARRARAPDRPASAAPR
jgi:hypothetical protein